MATWTLKYYQFAFIGSLLEELISMLACAEANTVNFQFSRLCINGYISSPPPSRLMLPTHWNYNWIPAFSGLWQQSHFVIAREAKSLPFRYTLCELILEKKQQNKTCMVVNGEREIHFWSHLNYVMFVSLKDSFATQKSHTLV